MTSAGCLGNSCAHALCFFCCRATPELGLSFPPSCIHVFPGALHTRTFLIAQSRAAFLFLQAISVPGLRLLERVTVLGQEADRTLASVAKLQDLGVPTLLANQERLVRRMREAREAQAGLSSRLHLLEQRSATAVEVSRSGKVDPKLFSDADEAEVRAVPYMCTTVCVDVWYSCFKGACVLGDCTCGMLVRETNSPAVHAFTVCLR